MKLIERLRLGGPNAAEVASEAADEIERLQNNHPNPADFRYWEGRYRDEATKVDRERELAAVHAKKLDMLREMVRNIEEDGDDPMDVLEDMKDVLKTEALTR